MSLSSLRALDQKLPKFIKPCRAGQWHDGVLTASTTAVLPGTLQQNRYFDDVPMGLAPDGSGGAFVLAAGTQLWPGTQGPFSLAHISPTGVRGPVTVLGVPSAWIGVLGYWSDGAIVASGSDRCIVVWAADWHHAGLVAQRYDVAGKPGWGPDPVLASTTPPSWHFLGGIVAEPVGKDGVIVAWYPETPIPPPTSRPIRVQRISAGGKVLFGADGLMLGRAALPPPTFYSPPSWLQLVPNRTGGAIVLWTDEAVTGADHVAMRVSGGGAPVGTPVTVVSNIQNRWRSMRRVRRAVSDGAGGFFLAYSDQAGMLRVLRCSPSISVLWNVSIVRPTHPMAFDIREDDRGGVLIAAASTLTTGPQLEVRRLDAAGNVTWELTSLVQFLLPQAAAGWPAHAWADLVKVVPDGSGGAIVVFQSWRGSPLRPGLRCICVDSQGTIVDQPQDVSARPTRQDFPVVISGGSSSAIVAWADDGNAASAGLDVWTQRVGCCPPSPVTGLDQEPELPCAIVEFPGLSFRELAVRLPCGNRDRQFGVLPLSRLAVVVRGLDVPGSLGNRDTPAPEWMRITFLGLPKAISLELRTPKARVVARSIVIEAPGKTVAGRALTFKPSSKQEQFIVFSHKGAAISDAGVRVRVNVEWGDRKPPSLPRPARRKT